jgi:hypothetical protein
VPGEMQNCGQNADPAQDEQVLSLCLFEFTTLVMLKPFLMTNYHSNIEKQFSPHSTAMEEQQ